MIEPRSSRVDRSEILDGAGRHSCLDRPPPRDYRAAISAVVRCGGDTDTTAAIVGGILGAALGKEGIPSAWLEGLMEWPRSVSGWSAWGTNLSGASPRPRRRASSAYQSLPFRYGISSFW